MLNEKIPFLELGSPRITIEVHALRSWKSHMRSYESCYTFAENNYRIKSSGKFEDHVLTKEWRNIKSMFIAEVLSWRQRNDRPAQVVAANEIW
ncbi:hypothetical protein Hdeb2414_s0006g00205641 [Helianthus debilis subsp. tardiflorus]